MDIRRSMVITKRKVKVIKTNLKKLLGESLSHLGYEFETLKNGIFNVKGYLFTFLSGFRVLFDTNVCRKIKVKQEINGCFRTDEGADVFYRNFITLQKQS